MRAPGIAVLQNNSVSHWSDLLTVQKWSLSCKQLQNSPLCVIINVLANSKNDKYKNDLSSTPLRFSKLIFLRSLPFHYTVFITPLHSPLMPIQYQTIMPESSPLIFALFKNFVSFLFLFWLTI